MMKHRTEVVIRPLASAVLILAGLLPCGCSGRGGVAQKLEGYTVPTFADAEGDVSADTLKLQFPSFTSPKLLWITGLHGEMVREDGTPAVVETPYRSDLAFDYMRHSRILQIPVYHTDRLFTLTGRQTDVVFPEGFGLPFYSDEVLTLTTRFLEPPPSSETTGLRQRIVLDYVLDEDLDEPMKPLFAASGRWVESPDGSRDRILRLPYDTRVHFITAPLHPLAGSIEVRDLSSGNAVYDSAGKAGAETAGVESDEYFSGAEGIVLLGDRPYLLADNLGGAEAGETDLSAGVLLYLRDKLFRKVPRPRAPVAHFEEPLEIGDEGLLLHTNHGDIGIALYPEVAPRHCEQILKLARMGVYDGVQFHRVVPDLMIQLGFPEARLGPPLTADQSTALRRLEAEFSDLPMRRWSVVMALYDNADPDSAVASFFILIEDARRLDQQYTIVGKVVTGLETVRTIATLPLKDNTPIEPAFIERAEVATPKEGYVTREGFFRRPGSSRDH